MYSQLISFIRMQRGESHTHIYLVWAQWKLKEICVHVKKEMLELWALGAPKNSQKNNEILNHIIRIIVSLYSMWVNPSLVVCVQDAILKVTVTVNMSRVARSLEINISWWTEDEWRKGKKDTWERWGQPKKTSCEDKANTLFYLLGMPGIKRTGRSYTRASIWAELSVKWEGACLM